MTTAAILSAQGLSRSYRGTGTEVGVLKEVNLDVLEGQVVCIVGASGAGKSTLLHILGSLDKPDTGQVWIRGQDVHTLTGKRLDNLRSETLGFVFQFHFLLPDFTALENVMMPALVARRTVASCRVENSSASRLRAHSSTGPRWYSPTSQRGTWMTPPEKAFIA
jgi:lipoprotein-releasing system ATP-binding protein